ncbi:MAG: hypothetical protein WCI41_03190 [bacterium]
MEESNLCNVVNVLYYLYFENRELVYHFERIWDDAGMTYKDEEYSYIFLGVSKNFDVDLEAYIFLCDNYIIEQSSGNEHESIYILTENYRIILANLFKNKKEHKVITE